jgi:hypothetical protein
VAFTIVVRPSAACQKAMSSPKHTPARSRIGARPASARSDSPRRPQTAQAIARAGSANRNRHSPVACGPSSESRMPIGANPSKAAPAATQTIP